MDTSMQIKFLILGGTSAVSSFLFGVGEAVVLLAFFGACIALSISDKPRAYPTALLFVAGSTVAGSVGSTGISFMLPDFPLRLAAFILAIIAFPLIEGILEVAKGLPAKIRDKFL